MPRRPREPAPRNLRAVKPGEVAEKLTITEAADKGDRRALLVALQTRVARTLESADLHPRDLAALSRQLQEIMKEIELFDVAAEANDPVGVTAKVPDDGWEGV